MFRAMQILRQYLQVTGMEQQELARRVGISDQDLSNLLNGKRIPGLKVIMRVHRGTGINLERLVREVAERIDDTEHEPVV